MESSMVRSNVMRFAFKPLLAASAITAWLAACGDQASVQSDSDNPNGHSKAGSGSMGTGNGGADPVGPVFEVPDASDPDECDPTQGACEEVDGGLGFCSDGHIGPGEGCDDANAVSGD